MTAKSVVGSPIQIADPEFFIRATMDSAPRGMMHRELLMNAIEAMLDAVSGETKRIIRYYADVDDDISKLILINSGKGMMAEELRQCADLARSIGKTMGLGGRDNRGEGGKVSVLPFNTVGERIRSRHGDDIHEVVLEHTDRGWERRRVEVEDEYGDTRYSDVWLVQDDDLTEAERERYAQIPGDFTEVKLLGQHVGQHTAYDPYNDGETGRLTVANEIFNRFYDFPMSASGPVQVQFHGPSFRDGVAWRELMPISRIVSNHPKDFEHLEDRFVTLPSGIKLEFLKSKEAEKSRSPWNQRSLGKNGARTAIVWRGEMYETLEGDQWRRESVNFGLLGLGSTLSLFIHLPDDAVVDDRYRQRLHRMDGHPLSLRDFRDDVVRNRPQWVLDFINARVRQVDSSDVQRELAKRAAQMSQRPVARMGGPVKLVSNNSGGGGGGQKGGKKEEKAAPVERATAKRKLAPAESRAGVSDNIPAIVWVTPDENENLRGRGAMFVDGPSPSLYLNTEYNSMAVLMEKVDENINNPFVREKLDVQIVKAVQFHVALKVGTCILYSMAHKGKMDWTDVDLKTAASRESLSIAFDMCIDDVGDIMRRVRNLDEYKDAVASAFVEEPMVAAG